MNKNIRNRANEMLEDISTEIGLIGVIIAIIVMICVH